MLGTISNIEAICFAIPSSKLRFDIGFAIFPFANANACKTGTISGFPVQAVLPVIGNSQVFSSIIEPVAVDMVNNHSQRRFHNETRKRYELWRIRADENSRIVFAGKAQADYIAYIFFVRASETNVKDLIINIRVNFNGPASNRESQKIGCALQRHRNTNARKD